MFGVRVYFVAKVSISKLRNFNISFQCLPKIFHHKWKWKELWRKEKEEATQAFQQERKKYEDQIETLQKQVPADSVQTIQTKTLSQVMEQSMTMSMISSTCGGGDDFTQEEDLYGWSSGTHVPIS